MYVYSYFILYSTNQTSELMDLSFESSLVLMPFLFCHTLIRVSQVFWFPHYLGPMTYCFQNNLPKIPPPKVNLIKMLLTPPVCCLPCRCYTFPCIPYWKPGTNAFSVFLSSNPECGHCARCFPARQCYSLNISHPNSSLLLRLLSLFSTQCWP